MKSPPTPRRSAPKPTPTPAPYTGDAVPPTPPARDNPTTPDIAGELATPSPTTRAARTRAPVTQPLTVAAPDTPTQDATPTSSGSPITPVTQAGLAQAAREMFTQSADAILMLDAGLIIQAANPAFTQLGGWAATQAQGRPCAETFRCRDPRGALLCGSRGCPADEALRAHGSVARELRWETRGGQSREVSATFTVARPAVDGAAPQVVVVARGGAGATSAANRTQGNLISMISHELRTPLNTINGFLEIVLDGQVGALNERQEEFLGYAQTGARQLMTLVEDILLISKADAGQFSLRLGPVEVAPLIESALTSQRAAAERAQVRLEVSAEPHLPTLQADELRLQQVLTNLISNAIKFTLADGVAQVEARLIDDQDERAPHGRPGDAQRDRLEAARGKHRPRQSIRFQVRDTGRGIRAADLTRIFERFYQSESGDEARAGGHGLGLAIAKLIVEQHHGRIWAESARGHGSTFSFTIPIEGRE
ncbi:MAG TPA: ATP-binding protein [Ktedonobacterales bacterium]|nr:ATP-binding protein [Ktedonobacterales bacterium]